MPGDEGHESANEKRDGAKELEDSAWSFVVSRALQRLHDDILAESISEDEIRARLETERDQLTEAVSSAVAPAAEAEIRRQSIRLSPRRARQALVLDLAVAVAALAGGILYLVSPSTFSAGEFAFALGGVALALLPVLALRRRDGEQREDARWEAYFSLTGQLEGLVIPKARQILGELGSVPFNEVSVRRTPGLSELIDPSLEVETRAKDQLVAALANLETASLGISGPRGAGKTTLVAAACEGRILPGEEPLGVVIPAPMNYDSVEFIPYLFNQLCLAILRRAGPQMPRRRLGRPLATFLMSYLGLGVLTLGLLIAVGTVRISPGLLAVTAPLIVGGVILVLGGMSIALGRFAEPRDPDAARALAELHAVRYRESVGRGWSTEAGPLWGVKVGGKREVWSSEEPPTLPDLVERYKQFVRELARKERPVVIGIDELDKMEAKDARKLLNDVKILFGVRHCYYLISVSEDALSTFERRGMPIRDVFDSSFDDVLHVAPLDIAQSQTLIQRRAVGLGEGAQLLCHCLSGGLPRELVRCARAIVATTTDGKDHLDRVTSNLVANRMRMIEQATTVVASKAVPPDGRQPVLIWLRNLSAITEPGALAARWDVETVFAELATTDLTEQDIQRQRSVVSEFAVAAYHADAVYHFFVGLTEGGLRDAVSVEDGSPAALELLAVAQQEMSVSLESAWTAVDQFRSSVGLDVVGYPF